MKKSALVIAAHLPLGLAVSPNFAAYKEKFGKHYETEAAESKAKECWEENVQVILNHKDTSVKLGENEFSDQCWIEFAGSRLLTNNNGICYKSPIPAYDPPVDESQDVDWVSKGAVTPVKNQGSCGSCWSFSATGAMEAAHWRATGKLISFSEQELVSCDTGGQDNGCKGGGPDTAFDWVIKQGGISLESDYPYSGKDGSCDSSKKTKAGVFKSFTYIDSRAENEKRLLGALQTEGPISIVVDATNVWQQYHGGIVTASNCGAQAHVTDHAVLAVGYGKDNGQAYYKVKNSWGTSWGESGYIRLAYGQNTCNCATCFSYFPKADGEAPPSPPGPTPPSPPSPPPGPTPPTPPSPPPPVPPPSPPSPPPPSPPMPPGFDCIQQMKQADCEAKASEGCHWCTFGAGMCMMKQMPCPGSVVV